MTLEFEEVSVAVLGAVAVELVSHCNSADVEQPFSRLFSSSGAENRPAKHGFFSTLPELGLRGLRFSPELALFSRSRESRGSRLP